MNILFLTSSAPLCAGDASSPFILSMAEDLQALGHHVTILAPHAKGSAREETIAGVRIVRFRYMFPEGLQSLQGNGGAMVRLKRHPFKALLVPCFILAQSVALWRLLRRESFAIIHSHWLLPQGLVGGVMARYFRIPHVSMVHGADVFGLQHPLWQWCKRQALRCSQTVIANSSATATIVHLLEDRARLEVIAVGANPQHVTPTDYSGQSPPHLLFVGRLFEGKGLHILLEAMAQLPEATLAVYGDGPNSAALQAQAKSLGIDHRVQFKGAQAHESVLGALAQADLFIAPSIRIANWSEAQGNAIIEAMMAGVPVIASDVGGIPDAVIHEQTGLLVPQKDVAALTNAILRLLQDTTLRQQLAQAGRAHAMAHFSREQTSRKIAAIYERLFTP